jgi:hypothetical protein
LEETLEPAKRFLEYAAAFEQTYIDDDWERLEPYFTEGAIYAVTGGPPLGGRFEGRGQVLGHLRQVLDDLDRRFDARRVEPVGEPKSENNIFEMSWRATYEKAGCPDLVFGGAERATFRDGRICLLEDIVDDGTDRLIQEHVERYLC